MSSTGAQETPPSADDFDLLPVERPADPATRARQADVTRRLGVRRKMLELHQLGGFLTLAGLTLTVTFGQINYLDKYAGGGDSGRFYKAHQFTAIGTAVIFGATGLLALFAPSPTDKPLRLDTSTLHKLAMSIATAGMLAQIILGPFTASKEGTTAQRNYALAHQIIGYTTLVATAAGFTVLTF